MLNSSLSIYLSIIFDWVIETTIMASILVGLILCVKMLLKNQLTPRWHYLLWLILIVRLILPWSPDSSYSIYSIFSKGYEKAAVTEVENMPDRMPDLSEKRTVIEGEPSPVTLQTTNAANTEEFQTDEPITIYTIALFLWLLGVMVLGLFSYFSQMKLSRYIQGQPAITDKRFTAILEDCKTTMSVQKNIPLLFAGRISSPTVFGFFHPRILLSSEYLNELTDQQLRHIFYHELAHIKRRDVGVNWLMHSLLILHWFNPLLWLAYLRMREDQELACDAYALTFMKEEEKISYGYTIINLLEHYAKKYEGPSLANLSRNKRTLKRRIFMIKKHQKKSYRWSFLGIMTVLLLSACSLLNAEDANEKVEEKPQQNEVKEESETETTSKKVEKEDGRLYGFGPEANHFIAVQAEELRKTTDQDDYMAKFEQFNEQFKLQFPIIDTAEGHYDYANLQGLTMMGSHFVYNIKQQEKQGMDPGDSTAMFNQTFEYIKQMMHDFDILVHKNGEGETYGLLYQLSGEPPSEFEEFIWGDQGFPITKKDYYKERFEEEE